MIVVDVILGAAVIALLAMNRRDKKLLKENKKLASQNTTFGQYLLGDGSNIVQSPHDWTEPIQDVVFVSKSPVSFDRVVLATCSCRKCQMVSKYIVEGHALAEKKGFQHMEGFFFDGVKVVNTGCIQEKEEETLDSE